MFECLLFTCIYLNVQMQSELNAYYLDVNSNEFVGRLNLDFNYFDLDGIQSTEGKIIYLNHPKDSNIDYGFVHSHPQVIDDLFGLICLPSEKDLTTKKLFNRKEFLYCGNNFILEY